jgi:molecular chaperone Hsp33
VSKTLRSFPHAEIDSMKDEAGEVVVVCEFCKSRYAFTGRDLERLYS